MVNYTIFARRILILFLRAMVIITNYQNIFMDEIDGGTIYIGTEYDVFSSHTHNIEINNKLSYIRYFIHYEKISNDPNIWFNNDSIEKYNTLWRPPIILKFMDESKDFYIILLKIIKSQAGNHSLFVLTLTWLKKVLKGIQSEFVYVVGQDFNIDSLLKRIFVKNYKYLLSAKYDKFYNYYRSKYGNEYIKMPYILCKEGNIYNNKINIEFSVSNIKLNGKYVSRDDLIKGLRYFMNILNITYLVK